MKKVSRRAKVVKLDDGERVWVGIDTHKRTHNVAMWGDRLGLLKYWSQGASHDRLVKALLPYKERIERVVYEAGPTGFGLLRVLRNAGFTADVVAPSHTPKTRGKEPKSDRLDARKLAQYAAKDLLQPIRVPSEQEEADRQVVRLRHQVVKKQRRIRQQIKSFLLQHGVPAPQGLTNWTQSAVDDLRRLTLGAELRFTLDILLDEHAYHHAKLREVEKRIMEIAKSERHHELYRIVSSVTGVGKVTAMTYCTELLDPERFRNEREVARFTGFAPGIFQSGEKSIRGPIMRTGNVFIRAVTVEAAWSWVRYSVTAREHFRRLLRNTADRKKAIVAMARRLAVLIWRLMVKKELYVPAA
jgi:transposase